VGQRKQQQAWTSSAVSERHSSHSTWYTAVVSMWYEIYIVVLSTSVLACLLLSSRSLALIGLLQSRFLAFASEHLSTTSRSGPCVLHGPTPPVQSGKHARWLQPVSPSRRLDRFKVYIPFGPFGTFFLSTQFVWEPHQKTRFWGAFPSQYSCRTGRLARYLLDMRYGSPCWGLNEEYKRYI